MLRNIPPPPRSEAYSHLIRIAISNLRPVDPLYHSIWWSKLADLFCPAFGEAFEQRFGLVWTMELVKAVFGFWKVMFFAGALQCTSLAFYSRILKFLTILGGSLLSYRFLDPLPNHLACNPNSLVGREMGLGCTNFAPDSLRDWFCMSWQLIWWVWLFSDLEL